MKDILAASTFGPESLWNSTLECYNRPWSCLLALQIRLLRTLIKDQASYSTKADFCTHAFPDEDDCNLLHSATRDNGLHELSALLTANAL